MGDWWVLAKWAAVVLAPWICCVLFFDFWELERIVPRNLWG